MKRILLPTDFSFNSLNAANYAIELFREEECDFFLVNTYTPSFVHSRFMASAVYGGGMVEDNVQSRSQEGLSRVLEQINGKNNNPNHHFTSISSFNLLTEELKDIIENEQIDLIVTGTKGASGFEEVFLGSNTVRMIKCIRECPILAIPENYKFTVSKKIGFATDFKRNFSAEVIEPLINLAKYIDASIDIVHINEQEQLSKYQESNKDILLEYLQAVAHSLHEMPYFASKTDVIKLFVEETNINLLAMIYYRHGYLEELVREPVVKRMAFHSEVPILVLPE